jgi:hypothetical protein
MHTRTVLPALLAFLLTGALVAAQTEVKKAQDPHGQVNDAAASKIEPATTLKFSVSGLTKDNVDKVKQSLAAMETQVYVCDGCKHEQAAAGRCSPCNLDLKVTKAPLFFEAVPSLETETIRVTPMAARTLRYSDLEGALMKNSIQIDSARFPVAGKARLVLLGGTLENSKAIEKALVDAKLFDLVKTDYDAATGEIHVSVHASATPPMRAKVISTIDGLGTKAKLSDVIWGPPTTPAKA